MEPVSTTIITYVSLKFVDQFIKEEGYGRLKKYIFPAKKYKNQLVIVFYKTIEEYEKLHPHNNENENFPFYHSQILFEELNNYILFKTQLSSTEMIEKFKANSKIIIPTKEQFECFYSLLASKINTDKKLKSLFIDENFKSKIFDIHSIIEVMEEKVDYIQNKVTSINTIINFEPDDEWFNTQCKSSILDLGNRYTPELNFETEIIEIFNGLGKTNDFQKLITKKFDEILIKGRNNIKDIPEIKEFTNVLEVKFEEIFQLFSSINFVDNSQIPFQQIEGIIKVIELNSQKIEEFYRKEERKLQAEKKDYGYYHKYGYELRNINEFKNIVYDFREFINGEVCKLVNNPYLILDGEAGIGKSHMIGDVISKRINNEYTSIFLLGQHFVTDESPWNQILDKIQLNINSDTFLNILNEKARDSGKRCIIFIDAINEGRGKYFWEDNIFSFINGIRKYNHLGLVLTIRSSYKNLIFPKDKIDKLNVIEYTLYGFRDHEYEASKLFFNNYTIELPKVPLLHPEFQNPLFLKLFCEGIKKSGQSKIPDGLQGITSIIEFFIQNVNEILSKPKYFHYSNGINLVNKSINAIIEYKIENDLRYVSYEKGIEIIEDVILKFVTKKGTFLNELISEGIFSKNLFWKEENQYEEGIFLAYERFEDHLTCEYLLNKYQNLEAEFKENGNLFKYVENEHSIYMHKGLIDAFTIQIPEKTNKEFYDYVPHLKDQYPVIESFVESLIWRKTGTINEESKDYVNDFVFSFPGTEDLFWETIISITSIPEHLYNAYSLHNYLIRFTMAERDGDWTQRLKYKYDNSSSVKRLIDWAWNENDKSHISNESIKLSAITLAWFHTSTNRQLRDCSTKALVCLLQDRIDVLIELLKEFENVNDPYVYERLFAVAYGTVLRTDQKEYLPELSEYIFETIFNKEEVYPHILLRDYARGVIEYTNYLGLELKFEITKARPPYKSVFELKTITNDEIDRRYKKDYHSKDYHKHLRGQNDILDSMATEYGGKMYGDFGRYTFESALRSWDINTNDLSNLAIEWIFEKYGYDSELHGKYDASLPYNGRSASIIERIGKKYQWIALHELAARVSDNIKKYGEWDYDREEEESYQGPWSPFIRDIDPTIIIKNIWHYNEEDQSRYWWSETSNHNWNSSNNDWIINTTDLPNLENLIQVSDNNNEEWLMLEGHPEWAEPKKIGEEKWNYAHKRLWYQIRGYIVKNEYYDKLKSWSVNQNYMGLWMPSSRSRYEIFNREFYWSPAYNYFIEQYEEDSEWRDIHDEKTGEFISQVIVPTEGFSWSEEFDKSKEESLTFLKPCDNIVKGMNLHYNGKEGEYVNNKKELICFAANIYHNSKSTLLIKKEPFIDYLKQNNLNILWTVLGEKQIIGGRSFREDYSGILEINGAYYFEKGEVRGVLNTKKV